MKGKPLGVIHFLNKTRAGGVYSEADELYGQILGDYASSLLASCSSHGDMEARSLLLTSLLQVSADIYKVIPDEGCFDIHAGLQAGSILRTLENLSKLSLKCLKSRFTLHL